MGLTMNDYVGILSTRLLNGRIVICLLAVVCLALGLEGCSSVGNPRPLPTHTSDQEQPKGPVSVLPKNTRAAQYYQPGVLTYDFQITAIVDPLLGDSIHPIDTTHVRSLVLIEFTRINQGAPVSALVHIDSIALQHGNNASTSLPRYVNSFTISQDGKVQANSKTDCLSTSSEQVIRGTEILPFFTQFSEATWTDTSVVITCRSGVPIVLERVMTYSIIQKNDTTADLFRHTYVTAKGTGIQWQQKVDVTGEGTANDTLGITLGRVRHISGTSYLDLVFTSALRTQRYRQTTYLTAMAR